MASTTSSNGQFTAPYQSAQNGLHTGTTNPFQSTTTAGQAFNGQPFGQNVNGQLFNTQFPGAFGQTPWFPGYGYPTPSFFQGAVNPFNTSTFPFHGFGPAFNPAWTNPGFSNNIPPFNTGAFNPFASGSFNPAWFAFQNPLSNSYPFNANPWAASFTQPSPFASYGLPFGGFGNGFNPANWNNNAWNTSNPWASLSAVNSNPFTNPFTSSIYTQPVSTYPGSFFPGSFFPGSFSPTSAFNTTPWLNNTPWTNTTPTFSSTWNNPFAYASSASCPLSTDCACPPGVCYGQNTGPNAWNTTNTFNPFTPSFGPGSNYGVTQPFGYALQNPFTGTSNPFGSPSSTFSPFNGSTFFGGVNPVAGYPTLNAYNTPSGFSPWTSSHPTFSATPWTNPFNQTWNAQYPVTSGFNSPVSGSFPSVWNSPAAWYARQFNAQTPSTFGYPVPSFGYPMNVTGYPTGFAYSTYPTNSPVASILAGIAGGITPVFPYATNPNNAFVPGTTFNTPVNGTPSTTNASNANLAGCCRAAA